MVAGSMFPPVTPESLVTVALSITVGPAYVLAWPLSTSRRGADGIVDARSAGDGQAAGAAHYARIFDVADRRRRRAGGARIDDGVAVNGMLMVPLDAPKLIVRPVESVVAAVT